MKLHRLVSLRLKSSLGFDSVTGDASGVYCGGSQGRVYALDTSDYGVRWQMHAKGFVPRVLAGDVLVLGGADGLRGVDVRTGARRWTSIPSNGIGHCDLWRGGLVRAFGRSHLYSVDPGTGSVVDTIPLGERWAVFGDDHLFRGDDSGGRCIDLRDGSVAWERPVFKIAREAAGIGWDPKAWVRATYHAPDVVVACCGLAVAAFQLATCETLWTATLPAGLVLNAAFELGCVVAVGSRETIALDVRTGRVKWIQPNRSPEPPPPNLPPWSVYRGTFVSREAGGLHLIDPETGRPLCSLPAPRVSAVAQVGELLVAVRADGYVNVFGTDRARVAPAKPKAPADRTIRARGGGLAFEEVARVKLPGLSWPSRALLTPDALVVSDTDAGAAVKLARDGWRVEWQKPAGTPEIAWAAGGMLLAPLARRARVVAFRASDGEEAWEAESQRGQAWVLDERRVLVAPSRRAGLRVLDVRTGEVLQVMERTWPRVLVAAGGRVVVASTRAPADEMEGFKLLTGEPGVDEAVAESYVADDDAAMDALLQLTAGDVAVVDVEEERTIWNRDLEAELTDMSGLRGPLRLSVVGANAEWLLLWHWTHEVKGSVLWGVSMVTGAVAWQARLDGRGPTAFGEGCAWIGLETQGPRDPPSVACVDIHTGRVRVRRAVNVHSDFRPVGSYGAYIMSGMTEAIDFYHPDEPTQRLPLRGTQMALAAPPELVLVDRHRVRVLREVATATVERSR